MKHIEQWIDQFDKSGTLYNNALRYGRIIDSFDFDTDKLNNFTKEDFVAVYRSQCTKSYEDVRTFAYYFRSYLKWLLDNGFIKNQDIIRLSFNCDIYKIYREEYNNSDRKEYINEKEFLSAYRDASLVFDYNNLWYATFLRCLWEGIYSEQWIAFKELRASDVDLENCVVHVHGTYGEYDCKVSEQLCKDLIQLSQIKYWERNSSKNTLCNIYIEGKYPDSVFKFENRRSRNPFEVSEIAFRSRARYTTEEAFGRPIMSKKIFVSGIANRIKHVAQSQGKTLSEFLSETRSDVNSPNHQIITDILVNCGIITFNSQHNYKTKLYNFQKDFE